MIARSIALVAVCTALSTSAVAAELTLDVTGADGAERIAATYTCGNGPQFEVTYVNAGPNSLALVPVDGDTLVFVAVLSGSGVRYASGAYIWWTKGREATLADERKGPDAEPLSCAEVGG